MRWGLGASRQGKVGGRESGGYGVHEGCSGTPGDRVVFSGGVGAVRAPEGPGFGVSLARLRCLRAAGRSEGRWCSGFGSLAPTSWRIPSLGPHPSCGGVLLYSPPRTIAALSWADF